MLSVTDNALDQSALFFRLFSFSSASLLLLCCLDSPSWFFPIAFTFGFVYLQPISSSPLLCLPFDFCRLAVKEVDLCPLFPIRSHVNYFQFNLIFFSSVESERKREKKEGTNLPFSIFLTHSFTHLEDTHFSSSISCLSLSLSFSHSFTPSILSMY